MKRSGDIHINRKPAFAGKFYPGDKHELFRDLKSLFTKAEPKRNTNKNLQALISPHAGYIFSGKVAASAFKQIDRNQKYKRVFILASSHQYYFRGAAVYNRGNYETPLGEIKVDTEIANKLLDSNAFLAKNEAHQFEHSLEVQLPFLQYQLKNDFSLVPIILGTNDSDICKKIAEVLKPWFTPENLFVISTDFSHYPKYSDAEIVDRKTLKAIINKNPGFFIQALEDNKKLKIQNLATSLCGWTSVLTLLYLIEKKDFEIIEIDYQNSGDAKQYGDKHRVVGYGALAIYEKKEAFSITDEEKREILEKAHSSISNFFKTNKRQKPTSSLTSGILNEKTGVFVSIYINDELRGCIGGFPQDKTLNELVQQMSVSAACDSRFETIRNDEKENIKLEISVLSPLKKIEDIKEIELGKHGIYIKQGYNSGTFLPQVAKKTGWNLEEFLGHCSRDKAHLGWEGWKTADLFTYEAVIFKD